MKREILGPLVVIAVRIIGAWPGSKSLPFRLLVWLFMGTTIICQIFDIVDYEHYTIGALMEAVAITITNMLSFVKFAVLWCNQGHVEECLDLIEEDWKKMRNEKHLAIMSRNVKLARSFCVAVVISYTGTFLAFVARTLMGYTREDPDNFQKRELVLKATYPFDVFHTPLYEFMQVVGILQGALLSSGNQISDGLLVMLTTHVNGQLDILHDKLVHFTDAGELPDIIRQHQRIIHFADVIDQCFKWIGLAEFLSTSLIISAVGYVLVTAFEYNLDSIAIARFVTYMFVMQLGAFIYCHTGNTLTEKTLNVRKAAYESNWADLPPEISNILIIIMMRADKPISITAGGFANLNYESFLNISRTAASYLSVIRAASE